MIITIKIEELFPESKEDFSKGLIEQLSIDYATNAIHGWIKEKEVIIFRFKNYGWINDNRWNTYNLTYDTNQIKIEINDSRTN